MLKINKFYSFCTTTKPTTPSNFEPLLWYYKSGKSTISISQHIVTPNQATKELYPNYYISEDMCANLDKLDTGFY